MLFAKILFQIYYTTTETRVKTARVVMYCTRLKNSKKLDSSDSLSLQNPETKNVQVKKVKQNAIPRPIFSRNVKMRAEHETS
jgi:hypothetical protein